MHDFGGDARGGLRRKRRDERPSLGERHGGASTATEGPPAIDHVTVAEAAVLLRVCTKTVRARIKSGKLEAYRHGRRILIPRSAIDRLIKSGPM